MEPIKSYTYEVRQVEAWASPEGWDYNNVWKMGEFKTTGDTRRAFTNYLRRKHYISFKKGRTRIEFDGDNYTIVDRATGEPLFDAIYIGWRDNLGT